MTAQSLDPRVDSLVALDFEPEHLPAVRSAHASALTRIDGAPSPSTEYAPNLERLVLAGWLGRYHLRYDSLERAQLFFQQALADARELDNPDQTARLQLQLGNFHVRAGDPETSRKWYDRARAGFDALGDSLQLAYTDQNIALLHIRAGELDRAVALIEGTLPVIRTRGTAEDLQTARQNLGALYAQLGRPERALPYVQESLAAVRAASDSLALAPALGNLAYTYQQLGNFGRALTYYDSSLLYSRQFEQTAITAVTLLDLSDGYAANGDPAAALATYRAYHATDAAALSERTRDRVQELESTFEAEQRGFELERSQAEVAALAQKTHDQRLQLLLGGLALLATAALAFLLYRKRQTEARQRATERDLAAARLENERLRAARLGTALAGRRQDLTDFALDIDRRNTSTRELTEQLRALRDALPPTYRARVTPLLHLASGTDRLNAELERTQDRVEEVGHAFTRRLVERFPDLTPGEKQLAGLIRLQLKNKEIAEVRGISEKSAKMARYRLRKKLGVGSEVDLGAFLGEV